MGTPHNTTRSVASVDRAFHPRTNSTNSRVRASLASLGPMCIIHDEYGDVCPEITRVPHGSLAFPSKGARVPERRARDDDAVDHERHERRADGRKTTRRSTNMDDVRRSRSPGRRVDVERVDGLGASSRVPNDAGVDRDRADRDEDHRTGYAYVPHMNDVLHRKGCTALEALNELMRDASTR